LAPQLLSQGAVTSTRPLRLTGYLAEPRILVFPKRLSLIKALLSLAETVVESGAILSPLEYYNELANQSSSRVALPQSDSGPAAKIYQVCSNSVKKLTAAVAICGEGVRSSDPDPYHLLVLLSASKHSGSPYLAVLTQVVRLLAPVASRKTLLESASPAAAWTALVQLESEATSTSRALME